MGLLSILGGAEEISCMDFFLRKRSRDHILRGDKEETEAHVH
jgi:hypothetical protein